MSEREEAKRLKRLRRETDKEGRLVMIGARAGIRARGDLERALAEPGSPFARGFRSELLREAQHGERAFPTILAALGAQYGELLNAAEQRVARVWDERYEQGYRAGYDRGVAEERKCADAGAGLPEDLLRACIALCHPDRHPPERHDEANRVTALLLAMRREAA